MGHLLLIGEHFLALNGAVAFLLYAVTALAQALRRVRLLLLLHGTGVIHRHLHRRSVRLESSHLVASRVALWARLLPLILRLLLDIQCLLDEELLSVVYL